MILQHSSIMYVVQPLTTNNTGVCVVVGDRHEAVLHAHIACGLQAGVGGVHQRLDRHVQGRYGESQAGLVAPRARVAVRGEASPLGVHVCGASEHQPREGPCRTDNNTSIPISTPTQRQMRVQQRLEEALATVAPAQQRFVGELARLQAGVAALAGALDLGTDRPTEVGMMVTTTATAAARPQYTSGSGYESDGSIKSAVRASAFPASRTPVPRHSFSFSSGASCGVGCSLGTQNMCLSRPKISSLALGKAVSRCSDMAHPIQMRLWVSWVEGRG